MSIEPAKRLSAQNLPHALSDRQRLEQVLGRRPLQVFLDYDGTLSPIVSHPQDALLDSHRREALQRLASRHPAAVVSGRELTDVRARVGLDQLYYAGNHGFEIAGPPGSGIDWEFGADYADELDDLYQAFAIQLPPLDGLIIEHKRYSLSVHYRLVTDEGVPALEQALSGLLAERPRLRLRRGKRVFEIRPAVDWHKGKAVRRLMEVFGDDNALPIFVGDDLTDEDAFEAIRETGLGILVGCGDRRTAATFHLADTDEVYRLLDYLARR